MDVKKQNMAVGIVVTVIVVGVLGYSLIGNRQDNVDYTALANCLTASGAKMYGAYWCPHCKEQEEMFGSSWQYASYVECSLPNNGGQTDICTAAGINGYPTWVFGDGTRVEGKLTAEQLARYSNCTI
jgi:hypothetical protein